MGHRELRGSGKPGRFGRGLSLLSCLVLAVSVAACTPAEPVAPVAGSGTPAAQPAAVSLGLRILVLNDGSALVGALIDRMEREGYPYDLVDLADAGRSAITKAALAESADGATDGHYNGIIVPTLSAAAISAAERTALTDYQKTFGVRMIETEATGRFPAVSTKAAPRYAGPIDGLATQFASGAQETTFGYLRGPVTFGADPGNPTAATLATSPTGAKNTFTPMLTALIPGTKTQGSLLGVLAENGSETMLATFAGTSFQTETQLLTHGMLAWLSRGVSTSFNRNYFSVHADDLLLPDAQWSIEGQCEVGRNCAPTLEQLAPVRMTAEDVDYLVDWQRRSGIKIDLGINGAGAALYADPNGRDLLMERVIARTEDLRLISHTWSHAFLGCEQVLNPEDWACKTDDQGVPLYRSVRFLVDEIAMNQAFLAKNNLKNYDPGELITGEHSGLAKPPEMPQDNPHLAQAVTQTGIAWIASDASQESEPRQIGSAMTVPRYPFDLDYNTPTARQTAAQYNWLHTSRSDGGSGDCEAHPEDNPCVAPIDLDTGFEKVIIGWQSGIAANRIASNDARPFFIHEANLASERLAYPLLDAVVAEHRAMFADNSPLLNPTMAEAGRALVRHQGWDTAQPYLTAKVSGRIVQFVNEGVNPAWVPFTGAAGSRQVIHGQVGDLAGEDYGGAQSGWIQVPPHATVEVELPQEPGFARDAQWSAKAGA